MDLTPHVAALRRELAESAENGDEDARALAERLTAPLEPAARLTLLRVLAAAAGEITRDLAPGSVDVRLDGLHPEFIVTPPPAPTAPCKAPEAPYEHPAGDDSGTARVNLRLHVPLKARAEQAAARQSLSLNAWLVRATAMALEPTAPDD